jgi:hypothetical protein
LLPHYIGNILQFFVDVRLIYPGYAGKPTVSFQGSRKVEVMNIKLQIAKQSGSKPIYILLVALSAFNLGRYSEHFSGSGWAG